MSDTREELESRIAAYIDGQLPPAEAARLEVFLANTDPRLAEEIIAMLADRHHLRSLPRAAAPPDLAGRIMDQIERSALLNDAGHLEHQPRPWWQSRAAIAAGFVLLIGGFAVFVAESVLGPSHESKLNPLVLNTPANPAVTSSPSLNHPLALGPAPAPPAGSEFASRVAGDATAPETLASAGISKKMPDAPDKSVKPGAPSLMVVTDKSPPLDAKAEAALQAQLARNQQVLNGGQLAAAQMGYATVNSPVRALADISAANSNLAAEPVVLTLVARNDQDFSRLRAALETIMAQDPLAARQQSALHQRYADLMTNEITYQRNNNALSPVDAGAPTQLEGQLALNHNAAETSEPQQGVDKVETLKDQSAKRDESAKAAESKAAATEKSVANITAGNFGIGGGGNGKAMANNAGEITFDNAHPFQFYSPKRGAFEDASNAEPQTKAESSTIDQLRADGAKPAIPPARAADSQAADNRAPREQTPPQASPQTASQTPAQKVVQAQSQIANTQTPAAAVCYRVALRPRQLEQLAREFRVDSITSGRQAFVIASETDDQPVAQTQDLAQLDRREQPQNQQQQQAPLQRQSAPAAPAPAIVPATAPTSAPAAALAPANQSSWVQCIITMQQPPEASAPARK